MVLSSMVEPMMARVKVCCVCEVLEQGDQVVKYVGEWKGGFSEEKEERKACGRLASLIYLQYTPSFLGSQRET